MWAFLSVIALAVNIFLGMAVGVGDRTGAEALGFVMGGPLGVPLVVATVLAIVPAYRNMKSFFKTFFWVSVLLGITKLSQLGKAVSETNASS